MRNEDFDLLDDGDESFDRMRDDKLTDPDADRRYEVGALIANLSFKLTTAELALRRAQGQGTLQDAWNVIETYFEAKK